MKLTIILSPPVTLESTRTPFFASACIASKTIGEKPVASKIIECTVFLGVIRNSDIGRRNIFRTQLFDQVRVKVRFGVRPNVTTSIPRSRNTSVASKPDFIAAFNDRWKFFLDASMFEKITLLLRTSLGIILALCRGFI